MKLFYVIYQLWHIGPIVYIGFVIVKKDSLTIKDDAGPLLLFVVFLFGLLSFYYRYFKFKKTIDCKSGITIMSVEFLLVFLIIYLMLYFNFKDNSLPG